MLKHVKVFNIVYEVMKIRKNGVIQRVNKCLFSMMRLTMFFSLLMFFSMSVTARGQQTTLKLKDVSLQEVFSEIKQKMGYRFVYNDQMLRDAGKISVEVTSSDVREILSRCLEKTTLDFYIEDNVVVIVTKKKSNVQDEKKKVVTVRGKIVDSNQEALPGVTVLIEGTQLGTTTKHEGHYVLVVPERRPMRIVYSFIGMVPQRIEYTGQEVIDVVLKEDVQAMEEVVVTGYQTMRKSDVVGSVTTIKASDVMMPAYSSIDQMLQGRVAGMMVMNSSSRVGTSPKIRIRGTSTILGNQDPLWVVDGIIQPDPLPIDQSNMMVDDLKNILGNQISWLNPADIETITVLKDASATAIYGSKAANGVIVITTKRGKTDRLTVNYSGTFSFRARPRYGLFNLMNSQERIQFSRETFSDGAIYEEVPVASLYSYEGIMQMLYDKQLTMSEAEVAVQRLANTNTDWLKLLTRNSFSHSHNISVSGGSDKVVYNASIAYSDQAGIEVGNDAKNMSGRVNVGIQLHPKLYADLSVVGTIEETDGYAADVNPMDYALNTSRAVPAYDENGNLLFQPKRSHYELNGKDVILGYNILNEMDHSYSENKTSRVNGTLNLAWNVLPWLKYEFVGGINTTNRLSESYAGEQTYYVASLYRGYDFGTEEFGSDLYKAAYLPYGGELFNSSSDLTSWNIQNKVTIQKTFKEDHRINLLVGTEVISSKTKDRGNTTFGYVRERGEVVVEPTPLKDLVPVNGGVVGYGNLGVFEKLYKEGGWMRTTQTANQFSVFATLAYSFKNRYVLNASLRNDASNRFGQDQNKRFDPTYSFGLSWNVAQEPWLHNWNKVLNQLTLRASYGIQGNAVNSISPDLILSQAGVKNFYGDYMSLISRLPNPKLTWERTKSWNFGLDLQLLQWITMNFEYYTKKSNNLVSQDIALENGRPSMEINGGRITNSGVEYSLNITPIRTKDWAWTIGLNSSKNWNEAKTRSIDVIGLRDFLEGSATKVLKEGYDLSSFWSFSFKGLNHDTGLPEFNGIYQTNEDGSFKRDDQGELILSTDIDEITDYLVYSGKSEPDFTGGLTTRLRWKDLTFGANFSLLLGAKKRLPSLFSTSKIPSSDRNLSKELINRWKKPGDELFTDIPVIYNGRVEEFLDLPFGESQSMYYMWDMSDARVVDASFLRCQQMSLTWNMNEKWCSQIGVKSLSLNFIVNNLFVIASKKFDGFDPELGDSVQPKTYSVGLNVGF